MTIIAALRSYFAGCPLLADGCLQVDFLQPEWGSYSLEASQTAPILKTYLDGSTRRQQDFSITSRCAYGGEILQQLQNIGFFEEITDWLADQMNSRSFPDLGEGRHCWHITPLSCGYPVGEDETSAYYQINMRLVYFQEA